MEVDESLLTGESDLVRKRAGDQVFSGSFCVTGSARFEAQQVGAASLANQVTAGARAERHVLTPMQREINGVIRLTLFVAASAISWPALRPVTRHPRRSRRRCQERSYRRSTKCLSPRRASGARSSL